MDRHKVAYSVPSATVRMRYRDFSESLHSFTLPGTPRKGYEAFSSPLIQLAFLTSVALPKHTRKCRVHFAIAPNRAGESARDAPHGRQQEIIYASNNQESAGPSRGHFLGGRRHAPLI